MTSYIIRRLLLTIPTLVIISLITFFLMHAIPGGPFAGPELKHMSPEVIANLNKYYHLDDPIWKQYGDYLWNLVRGDLGPSYADRGRTVNDIIGQSLPASALLGLAALGVAMLIGIPLGILAALKQNTAADYLGMFIAIAGVSVPAMTLGPLLIWGFALQLKILPVAMWGTWQQIILPAFTLGFGSAAILARLTRASMLQVLREDYIRTARAKGLPERRVTVHHALRNALIPVITILGPLFAGFITGSMVVEQVFAIPGMGKFFVTGVMGRNYPLIMGTVLLYAVFLILANLVVDILYARLDPRIRYT
jgi:ABC-type dipeptide/oligopeptide/nickel transport system permease component